MIGPEESAQLCAVPFLSSLNPESLQRLSARAVTVRVPAGEIILNEGQSSDCLFVIASGTVQVFTTSPLGTDIVLARLETGQWFGEQALSPGAHPRTSASVRSLADCTLLVLARKSLTEVLEQDHELLEHLNAEGDARRSLRNFRLQDGIFSSIGLSSTDTSYRVEKFAAGHVVFRQGDPPDRVHLILSGRAHVKQVANGKENLLLELRPGQFFGELAILNNSPRSATVEAVEDMETASLDGTWFRATHAENAKLRSVMDSLSSMYLIPRRGLMTLQSGQVGGKPSQVVVHTLPDGRRVVSMRLVGRTAFTSRVTVDLDGSEIFSFEDKAPGVYRELNILAGKIVRIYSEGQWTGLGEMLNLLLDGTPVEEWQLALFRERGDFRAEETQPHYEGQEVICACTKTTCAQIMDSIRGGCHTLDAVSKKTNATMVCGGCAPLVNELVGKSDWSPAKVVDKVQLSDDVRMFRIRPSSGNCGTFLPGQHVLLQARIDNRWIQRAYTISSAPEMQDAYEITVKREPQGIFSRWLFDRMEGHSLLRISPPGGNWYLPAAQDTDVVFLAGGIGVTPALSMLRSAGKTRRPFRLHLDYSVSRGNQAICREELEALARDYPNLTVHLRVTGEQGRLDRTGIGRYQETYPSAIYYICGSSRFVDGMRALLEDAGVGTERIRVEVFAAAGEKPKRRAEDGSPSRPGMMTRALVEPVTPQEQARDVLQRYYTVTGAVGAFPARWNQVEACLKTTGTYQKTKEELTYAARLAWRNSVRCIGRLYWEALALRDFRHATTGEEMLDAIMGHIEMATNGGQIRPVITVFPPRDPSGKSPRVWSPQLFRYAAYREPGGTMLGDPANRRLTEVAMALGWKPPQKRSAFDLLPVIVQAVGERPVFREIPKELVLEVDIVHPEYPWFKDLGLRWYALPAVSGMLMVAGGIEYPAAPFNGWYMGTEIGARNFGDRDRYDMLPAVARRMGLDTTSDRTLWRDRALVELNVAVLHSYDRAGITMMDHHAASQSFDKFETIEAELGRTVNAKWSWLVPPISGSAVTVFHRDSWMDTEVKPNYYAQPDPWDQDHSWKA